jgi:SAM-dependent methyltransferase
MTTHANTGTGPGPITPDGCAVAFYALVPPAGEAEIVHAAITPAASVLELGCGTGRILRRLAELGHPVVGIDESPDMLDNATGLDTVCSSIETLDLRRTFDAVLLASTLINTPDPAACAAMVDTARRHTTNGGSVVIQRHPPQWFDTLVPSSVERDGIQYTIGAIDRDGPMLTATIQYQVGKHRWTHTFTTRYLSDDELAAILRNADFRHVRWLTADHTWLTAAAAGR